MKKFPTQNPNSVRVSFLNKQNKYHEYQLSCKLDDLKKQKHEKIIIEFNLLEKDFLQLYESGLKLVVTHNNHKIKNSKT